jgi:uncharacterized protein (TIGR03437 family)
LGDRQLPLIYVSPGQINAQIPFDTPVDSELPLVIQNGQQLSPPITLTIVAAAPGLFTSADGQAIVANASQNNSLVTADAPAQAGDVLIFYGTGLGPVEGGAPTGDAAPSAAVAIAPVSMSIGGQAAAVAYAGLTPGLIGLYQINVTVPTGAGTGAAVPVVVTQGGVDARAAVALK